MSRVLTVDEIMAILPESPRRIAALTDGLTPAQLHAGSSEPSCWRSSSRSRPTLGHARRR